ncbi:hypothetical protein [Rhizobium sp. SL42]|uniref:hypothetical protein n=1 Tax=Rhizobium sp. SL42 TaxID=2806346 RepID=UPI001F234F17|nr:hypothetical protein [Rhizobium sp. SL42]UJW77729.1 hypothetical protein IM739_22700 [Rhizobium sp. SL42]
MNTEAALQLEFLDAERPVEKHAVTAWRGISVEYQRLKLPAEYEFQWGGSCHISPATICAFLRLI